MIEWARNGGSQRALRGSEGMKTSVLAFSTTRDANAMNSDKISGATRCKEEVGRGLRALLSHLRFAVASKKKNGTRSGEEGEK